MLEKKMKVIYNNFANDGIYQIPQKESRYTLFNRN